MFSRAIFPINALIKAVFSRKDQKIGVMLYLQKLAQAVSKKTKYVDKFFENKFLATPIFMLLSFKKWTLVNFLAFIFSIFHFILLTQDI